MRATEIPNIDRLSIAEKIDLIEDLWALVDREAGPPQLSDSQLEELERRYREAKARPEIMLSRKELNERIAKWM